MQLVVDILLAFLAVFGLYALVRCVAVTFFSPPCIGVLLEIATKEQAAFFPILLSRARESFFLCAKNRVVVLADKALAQDEAFLKAVAKSGVDCYFVALEGVTERR